jgi:hypothetical protein
MSLKLYLIVSGAIFLLVGLFHFFRLVYQWPIVVGPRTIPFALSYVGCPVSSAYCVWAGWLLWASRNRRALPPNHGL